MQQKLKDLALAATGLQAQLETPELSAARMSADTLARLRGDLERSRERQETLRRQQTETEAILRTGRTDVEDLAAAREQLAEAERTLQRLCHRLEVYQTTLATLRAAREQTLHNATALLASSVGELFSRLTGGRYTQVTVDGDTLEPVAYSSAKDGPADLPHDLSVATREQLYLAARLALVKLLWPEEGPPLLLDDPLVNFDEERHGAACELLRAFGEERQILMLSCSDRAAPYAHQVVDLSTFAGGVAPAG